MKIKNPVTGEDLDAIPVEVMETVHGNTVTTLQDGTLIKTKVVVVSAVKAIDHWLPDGTPIYTFEFALDVNIEPSTELLKPTDT